MNSVQGPEDISPYLALPPGMANPEAPGKVNFGVSLDAGVAAAVDRVRGDVPRSTFIELGCRLLVEVLERSKTETPS
jgi:hypothetical protein